MVDFSRKLAAFSKMEATWCEMAYTRLLSINERRKEAINTLESFFGSRKGSDNRNKINKSPYKIWMEDFAFMDCAVFEPALLYCHLQIIFLKRKHFRREREEKAKSIFNSLRKMQKKKEPSFFYGHEIVSLCYKKAWRKRL